MGRKSLERRVVAKYIILVIVSHQSMNESLFAYQHLESCNGLILCNYKYFYDIKNVLWLSFG